MFTPNESRSGGRIFRRYAADPYQSLSFAKSAACPLADSFSVHKHVQCVLHGAGGSDLSGIDEENFIRICNRIEAVRDDDFRR